MDKQTNQGISFYTISTGMLREMPYRKLIKSCKAQSIAVILATRSIINNHSGYYVEWNDETCFLISEETLMEESEIVNIIYKAVEFGVFDKGMYETHKILTSYRIQEEFLFITKRRKENPIKPEYNCTQLSADVSNCTQLSAEPKEMYATVNKNDENVNKSGENVDNGIQLSAIVNKNRHSNSDSNSDSDSDSQSVQKTNLHSNHQSKNQSSQWAPNRTREGEPSESGNETTNEKEEIEKSGFDSGLLRTSQGQEGQSEIATTRQSEIATTAGQSEIATTVGQDELPEYYIKDIGTPVYSSVSTAVSDSTYNKRMYP